MIEVGEMVPSVGSCKAGVSMLCRDGFVAAVAVGEPAATGKIDRG